MGPLVKVRMVFSKWRGKGGGLQFGQMAKLCWSLVSTEYEKGLARATQRADRGRSEVLPDPGGLMMPDRETENHDWTLLEGRNRWTRSREGIT